MDIEREIGISKTAAFRLAATMTARGLLVKDARTKQYRIGPLFYQIARNNPSGDLVTVAQRFIHDLVALTEETVALTVRTEYEWVVLDAVESGQAVRVWYAPGKRNPLYVGSPGKLHLAYLPTAEQARFFQSVELKQVGPNTITDPEKLKAELNEIRESGYSFSNDEGNNGAAGISAPIWDSAPEPLATLTVMFPVARMTPSKLAQLIEQVPEYARRISQALRGPTT